MYQRFTSVIVYCFLFLAVLLNLCMPETVHAASSKVYVEDQAEVLNVAQVTQSAASFPYELSIYTTNSFQGDAGLLASDARQHIYTTNSGVVVMMIDTVHRHIAIVGNSDASFTDTQYQDAISAFGTTFHQQASYTAATIAAIEQLSQAASGNGWSILIGLGGLFVLFLIICLLAAFTNGGGGGNSRGGGSIRRTYYSSSSSSSSSFNSGGGAIGSF